MLVVHSAAHLGHDPTSEVETGAIVTPYERPARAEAIHDALAADADFSIEEPDEHGLEPIVAVHDAAYVAFLEEAWTEWARAMPARRQAIPDSFPNPALRDGMGPGRAPTGAVARLSYYGFDTATVLLELTYAAARAAADGALTATDAVLQGDPVAYALCRPPGHHAPRAAFGGYCFLNNAAIAAEYAVCAGAARVAVLDVDYHHGNGTQQIFYERGDVLYVSLHGDPNRAYPYFTGFADERGAGAGAGATLNLALDAGCDDSGFLDTLTQALDVVDRFEPELVVVSLGVDTYGGDPLGDLAVTDDAYHPAGQAVAAIDRPLVVVQEGGYAVGAMGGLVRSFLRGAARLPVNPR
jgi:acetoin utilization deacetylase AcuC-like enzyme